MTALVIGFDVVPLGAAMVNVTGTPTVGLALAVIVTVGAFTARIVTVASFAATAARATVSRFVVRLVRASPFASVTAEFDDSEPASAEKITGAPASGLPPASTTTAVNCTVPPVVGTVDGVARSVMRSAAAPPTRISIGSDLDEPENAEIVTVPD
jgi:hypothetical protein